jgi:hypothetical protein
MDKQYNTSIQWLCDHVGVIRIHEKGGTYGDPYIWACTIGKKSDTTVMFYGALQSPPSLETIGICLLNAGFKELIWERIKGGKVAMVSIGLESYARRHGIQMGLGSSDTPHK